ncbi:hypothetical protein F3Y22_tig00004457pilonHSYRG00061 [Hibiscus syriacus]|uniref:BED-type domain-containing protein n=1 Tax=Hibiscus syriacus TaxID=106335 RepID=A0A6A3CM43_HIBSY|nr:hypothetical protein F3Y22_tig00004457pilonHSYRG00061 [Hibiscus syriacus]
MSNLGENSISSTSHTINSPQLSTEGSPSPSFEGNSVPTLSQPNVVVENNVSSECTSSKLKSMVWDHFKKEKINNEWKAICNHCKNKFNGESKNGTSHLRDHIKRCKKRVQVDIRQQVLIANQKKSDGKLTIGAFSFNQDVARKELSKMIIMHEYPLSIVDHSQFRKYCSSLQPMFEMPTRNTIKRDILDLYEKEKRNMLSKLEANEGIIAITTDMWTSDHQNKGYMVVTAHYIDNSWSLQKHVIRKLTSITVDNCSVNDGVIKLLVDRMGANTLLLNGAFFHMRCCAHILHLIVKDGLSVIGDGIERIRHSVLFWSATPKRWERFEEAARQLCISTTKKLCSDVRTRWNSTFLMLQTALSYKDVFTRCVQLHRDPLYKYLPTDDDWVFASVICDKLKLFYEITEGFSVLDPRYKTTLLEYYFENIYGVTAEHEVERIVQLCRDLVTEYEERIMSSKNEPQPFNGASLDSVPVDLGNPGDFDAYVSRKRQKKTQVISELDRYLEVDVISRTSDFDILTWWKTIGPQFPILQAIARDIYAIPVSTVASESTFSNGGRLVNAQRNRLHHSTVEALACCQNWLWAEEESNSNEGNFYEDDESRTR